MTPLNNDLLRDSGPIVGLTHRYTRKFVLSVTEEVGTNRVEFKLDFAPEASDTEKSLRMVVADVVMEALYAAGFLVPADGGGGGTESPLIQ